MAAGRGRAGRGQKWDGQGEEGLQGRGRGVEGSDRHRWLHLHLAEPAGGLPEVGRAVLAHRLHGHRLHRLHGHRLRASEGDGQ